MLQNPQHVYLDLDVINNDYTTSVTRPYVRCEEIRNTPFLDGDSAEYFCSIVRFTIQTGNTLTVFNERLFDLFVGMQHTFESNQGDAHYRLTVAYNGSNRVTRDVIASYNAVAE
ncbi:MAG: hypothetical protein ACKPKO_52760, partial [Candidatus Fonsibacter sp.]